MKLPNVKHDRLVIDDAKSAAGNRKIPIHKNITQLVDRLVDNSTDEYLLSGLSSTCTEIGPMPSARGLVA